MRVIGTLLFFLFGATLGALVGALIAMMLAPESGQQLRVRIRERIDEGRAARDLVEVETAEILRQKFRNKVGDPDALTGE